MTQTISLGLHRADLDPVTGMGVLILPRPTDDVWLQGSLNGADLDAAIGSLLALGWSPLYDDDGAWIEEGQTRQGCPVLALYGIESVIEHLTMGHLADSRTRLLQAADAA